MPVTAQTFVLCVNGLLFEPPVSIAASGIYVGIGMASVCLPSMALAPYGPSVSAASAGYVTGFVLSSVLLASAWLRERLSEGEERFPFMATIAALTAAQGTVLTCGALWLAASRGLGVGVSVRPYLPGLALKAVAAALFVRLCGGGAAGFGHWCRDLHGDL